MHAEHRFIRWMYLVCQGYWLTNCNLLYPYDGHCGHCSTGDDGMWPSYNIPLRNPLWAWQDRHCLLYGNFWFQCMLILWVGLPLAVWPPKGSWRWWKEMVLASCRQCCCSTMTPIYTEAKGIQWTNLDATVSFHQIKTQRVEECLLSLISAMA